MPHRSDDPHVLISSKTFRCFQGVVGAQQFGDDGVRRMFPLIAIGTLGTSAFGVAVLNTAPMAIGLLGSLLSGDVADRKNPRQVMLIANGARFAIITLLTLAAVLGHLSLVSMAVVAIALAFADAFFNAGLRVSINRLIHPDDITTAMSRLFTIETLVGMAAPVAAGAMLGIAGPWAAMATIALGYAVATALVWFFPNMTPGVLEETVGDENFWARISAGFSCAWSDTVLRDWIITTLIINMGSIIGTTVTTVYVVQDLGISASVLAMSGAGSFVAAFIASLVAPKLVATFGPGKIRLFATLLAAVSAATIPTLGPVWGLTIVVLGTSLWSLAVSLVQLSMAALLQDRAPVRLLGRVGSAFTVAITGAMLFASIASGALATFAFSARAVSFVPAVLAVASAVMLLASPLMRWKPGQDPR